MPQPRSAPVFVKVSGAFAVLSSGSLSSSRGLRAHSPIGCTPLWVTRPPTGQLKPWLSFLFAAVPLLISLSSFSNACHFVPTAPFSLSVYLFLTSFLTDCTVMMILSISFALTDAINVQPNGSLSLSTQCWVAVWSRQLHIARGSLNFLAENMRPYLRHQNLSKWIT